MSFHPDPQIEVDTKYIRDHLIQLGSGRLGRVSDVRTPSPSLVSQILTHQWKRSVVIPRPTSGLTARPTNVWRSELLGGVSVVFHFHESVNDISAVCRPSKLQEVLQEDVEEGCYQTLLLPPGSGFDLLSLLTRHDCEFCSQSSRSSQSVSSVPVKYQYYH